MALSLKDRERVRYHLGFQSTAAASSIQLGIPRGMQTLFLIENAMTNLLSVAEPRVQQMLDTLDGIEQKLIEAQDYLAVASTDGVTLRGLQPGQSHPDALEREYSRWADRLANVLGCSTYPGAARFRSSGPGVRNA